MGKSCDSRKTFDTYLSKNLHRNPRLKALRSVYPPVFRIALNLLQENENVKLKRRIFFEFLTIKIQKMDDFFLFTVGCSIKNLVVEVV